MASYIESSFDHEFGDEVLIAGVVWILIARPENWYECIGPHMMEFDGRPVHQHDSSDECRCPPGYFYWLAQRKDDTGIIEPFDMSEVEWRPATAIDRLAALVEDTNE